MIKITKRTHDLLDLDAKYISPSYTRDHYFVADHGLGSMLYDIEGNRFVDFTAGIAVNSTGHCHPDVVKAITKQANKMIHMSGTDFYYESQIRLAERLAEAAPTGRIKNNVFFCNSGAEANEAAMKLARYISVAPTYIAFYGAFHGRTLGALSLTSSKTIQRAAFEPLQVVNHIPYANCAECPFNAKEENCVKSGSYQCLNFLTDYVLGKKVDPADVAAVFVEPIQGEGGYIVPPKGWLKALQKITNDNHIFLVMDEVQAGMGRTGKLFACENFGVQPDMITVAKGIASGMPLGALISFIMEWQPGTHASTFGGNPISCAAALATLDIIEKKSTMDNVKARGKQINAALEELGHDNEHIVRPRGLGLMRAVDIVNDGKPAPELRNKIIQNAFKNGLLILGCGKSGIRFCPPLIIKKEEVDEGMNIFIDAVKENT